MQINHNWLPKLDKTSGSSIPQLVGRPTQTANPVRRLKGEVAVIETDEYGFISKWCNKAEQIYGYEYDDIVGKHIASLYTAGDLFYGKPVHELQAVEYRGGYVSYGWQQRKNGQHFWTYSECLPIKDESGKLMGYRKFVVETRAGAHC